MENLEEKTGAVQADVPCPVEGDRRPGESVCEGGWEALGERVQQKLCDLAFAGGGTAQQVRSLELLAKLLGLFDGERAMEPVTIVEDL